MNSIRDDLLALDTNILIFAVRKEKLFSACEILLFDKLPELKIHIPLQVFLELQHNLIEDEMRGVLHALNRAGTIH